MADTAEAAVGERVIVVGYDAWTEGVVRALRLAGVEFVVIVPADGPEPGAVRAVDEEVVVVAERPDRAAFAEAGIDGAEAVLVATNDDHWNVLAVLTAGAHAEGVVVASYASSDDAARRMRQAGADVVLDVGRVVGEAIGRVAVSGESFDAVLDSGRAAAQAVDAGDGDG